MSYTIKLNIMIKKLNSFLHLVSCCFKTKKNNTTSSVGGEKYFNPKIWMKN